MQQATLNVAEQALTAAELKLEAVVSDADADTAAESAVLSEAPVGTEFNPQDQAGIRLYRSKRRQPLPSCRRPLPT